MAIQYPYDLLSGFPGWFTDFDLMYRQEQSRSQGGVTYVKDMGTPLWKATYQTRQLRPNEMDMWKAKTKALEGGLKQFIARPLSRCYPIAYPKGRGLGDVSNLKVSSIGADRKTITMSGRPAGYIFSVGDYIQIGTRNLHQVVGVDGLNVEIRPHLWPETKVNDPVKVIQPMCKMLIVPGTLTTTSELATGRGAVSFEAVESR